MLIRNLHRKRKRAGGIFTVELMLILPMIALTLFWFIALCQVLMAQQIVQNAAREGARVAAIGGNQAAVEVAVRRVLVAAGGPVSESAQITVVYMNPSAPSVPGSAVVVAVQAPIGAASPFFPAMLQSPFNPLSGVSVMQME